MDSSRHEQQDREQQLEQPRSDAGEAHQGGEGAASALAHMKSQMKLQRRQAGEDDSDFGVRK